MKLLLYVVVEFRSPFISKILIISPLLYFMPILGDNDLTGDLPTELGDLDKLKVLDVRKCLRVFFYCLLYVLAE